jgi:hypothetical protein
MNTKNNFLIILSITFLFSSCKKDKMVSENISPKNDCMDFIVREGPSIDVIYHDTFQFKKPHFNPNNPNEFVYYYIDYESKKHQLLKYNILTKEKLMLADNVKIISHPKWSKKGWIAFDNLDYNIWKVKDDGSNLTKVTNNTTNLYPVWDASGERLIYQYAKVLASHPTYILSVNSDNDTDTLGNVFLGSSEISDNNRFLRAQGIAGASVEFGYFDINKNLPFETFYKIFEAETNNTHHGNKLGRCWGHDNQIFYYTNSGDSNYNRGLFLVYDSNRYKKLIDFCETKEYSHISASSDGKYLVGERIDRYYNSDENSGKPIGVYENSSIYLIDLNTLEEIKVEL